jgi:hypothetical protein
MATDTTEVWTPEGTTAVSMAAALAAAAMAADAAKRAAANPTPSGQRCCLDALAGGVAEF